MWSWSREQFKIIQVILILQIHLNTIKYSSFKKLHSKLRTGPCRMATVVRSDLFKHSNFGICANGLNAQWRKFADQPLSHSATLAEWLTPATLAEWLSGCSSGWVAAPATGRVAEWLSGCVSHSGRVAEWGENFRHCGLSRINTLKTQLSKPSKRDFQKWFLTCLVPLRDHENVMIDEFKYI